MLGTCNASSPCVTQGTTVPARSELVSTQEVRGNLLRACTTACQGMIQAARVRAMQSLHTISVLQEWATLMHEASNARQGRPIEYISELKIAPGLTNQQQQQETQMQGTQHVQTGSPPVLQHTAGVVEACWPTHAQLNALFQSPIMLHATKLELSCCSVLSKLPTSINELQQAWHR